MAKANEAIDRTMEKLKGKLPKTSNGEKKSDPFLDWGELFLHGTGNPKRRSDD